MEGDCGCQYFVCLVKKKRFPSSQYSIDDVLSEYSSLALLGNDL